MKLWISVLKTNHIPQRVLVTHVRTLCYNTANNSTNFSTHTKHVSNRTKLQEKFLGANKTCRRLSSSYSKETAIQNILLEENKSRTLERIPKMRSIVTNEKVTVGAAVLVPLCTVNGVPSVLFTLRSSRLRSHRGEVSFPGGMCDSTDRDVVHTALRETEEELGIPSSTVDVWGPLKPIPDRKNTMTVVAVLGNVGELDPTKLKLSPREVAEVFTLSFSHLLDPAHQRYTTVKRRHDNYSYTMPVWLGGPHRVWGLTAIMLDQVLVAIATDWYRTVLRSSWRQRR
ncbi:PREDICTED: nucleoside diphosphate-linked moiety X motif 8-like isoform X2 [Branchiostoma belcheri]|uniref:Nucleoside diphosphate-linked moiety X motif 8-like isoform X2 n=1 Tax=Branchiostoma belcheri TaxID=7741 RepID=A0A6P4YFR4_BRABE|nr:PREDICTED: nucleoside diphosphate-linked moiety X motif 8-like isoform X2 [Branchiostoma belcheri]